MSQKTNYFSDLLEADKPVAREVNYAGKTKPVHFRRLTGAERIKLVSGQRVRMGGEHNGTFDIDFADLHKNRHMLVQFTAVDEEGAALFGSIADVQALPEALLAQLVKHAEEVNNVEDEPGKS